MVPSRDHIVDVISRAKTPAYAAIRLGVSQARLWRMVRELVQFEEPAPAVVAPIARPAHAMPVLNTTTKPATRKFQKVRVWADVLDERERRQGRRRGRRNNGFTDAEILEGLAMFVNREAAAEHFQRSTNWVTTQELRFNIHEFTRRPRLADPVAQQADVDLAIQERAIALDHWHYDKHGVLQKYASDDPYKGLCPNLLDRRPT